MNTLIEHSITAGIIRDRMNEAEYLSRLNVFGAYIEVVVWVGLLLGAVCLSFIYFFWRYGRS